MKKKVNPRRVPASKADVQKAKKQATSEAVEIAFAILLSALRDKEGFGYTRLRRVWSEVEYIADSKTVMKWNYNAQDYDPNKTYGSFELIPIGNHRCRIASVTEGQTKKEPIRDMLTLEYAISGYDHTLRDYVVLDPANPQRTNQTLGTLFACFGIQPGNMATQTWIGKVGGCRVKHEKYTGTDGNEHDAARIAFLLKPDEIAKLPAWRDPAGAAASQPAPTPTVPQVGAMPPIPETPDDMPPPPPLDPSDPDFADKLKASLPW